LSAKADLGPEDCVPVIVVVVQTIVLHLPAAVPILFAGGTIVTKVIYVSSATVTPNNLCGVVSVSINLDEVLLQHPTTIILATGDHSVFGGKVVTECHTHDLAHLPVQPILLVATVVAFGAFWTGGGGSIGWFLSWKRGRERQIRKVFVAQVSFAEAGFSFGEKIFLDIVRAHIETGVGMIRADYLNM
jgi:hypothetical protein